MYASAGQDAISNDPFKLSDCESEREIFLSCFASLDMNSPIQGVKQGTGSENNSGGSRISHGGAWTPNTGTFR